MQIHNSVSRKLKTKLHEKPTDCKTLFHSHSHNPLSCKEGIIYSQLLQYSIISEDHILQEELNNLTRILLARAYPLHLIIKNIKKALTHNCINLLSQRTPQTVTNILLYTRIGTQLPITPHSPLFGHVNPYHVYQIQQHSQPSCPLKKDIASHARIPNTTHIHPQAPI